MYYNAVELCIFCLLFAGNNGMDFLIAKLMILASQSFFPVNYCSL